MTCEHDYWTRIRNRAAELGTDGCTGGTSIFRDCCLEHDVHRRDGKMLDGTPINDRENDARFRSCMQARSTLGWWSPIAWGRWLVVRGEYVWRQIKARV